MDILPPTAAILAAMFFYCGLGGLVLSGALFPPEKPASEPMPNWGR